MATLKFQEAQKLLKKILNNPKAFNLKAEDGEILGHDQDVAFRFHKVDDRAVFEVTIDDYTFSNNTGEWQNAMIMLESTNWKLEREVDEIKIKEALNKLKRYLSTDSEKKAEKE